MLATNVSNYTSQKCCGQMLAIIIFRNMCDKLYRLKRLKMLAIIITIINYGVRHTNYKYNLWRAPHQLEL